MDQNQVYFIITLLALDLKLNHIVINIHDFNRNISELYFWLREITNCSIQIGNRTDAPFCRGSVCFAGIQSVYSDFQGISETYRNTLI